MINVMFDHQIFVAQRYGGVSRYFCELSESLEGLGDIRTTIVAPFHVNAYLRRRPRESGFVFYFPYPRRGLPYRLPLIAPLARAAAKWQRPDILHETYYDTDRSLVPGVRVVATLHDMIGEKFPHTFGNAPFRTARKLQSLRRADHIICVSENTRRDLVSLYPEFQARVSVVHHGVAPPKGSTASAPDGPYLLYVGTRGGYKNFPALLDAYLASSVLRTGLRLILFGGGPLSADEQARLHSARISQNQIEHIDGSDDRLEAAYRGATALVFPSLYEGFGMPLLEAMANGCPVICSDASCFPEICRDAAVYFNADDGESIRSAIESTVGASDRLQDLAERGATRVKQFTWHRCAEGTAAVYRALAS